MKRLWQRHLLVVAADKNRREEAIMSSLSGMMGGFLQGMMGASLHQSLSNPDMVERLKEVKERRRRH